MPKLRLRKKSGSGAQSGSAALSDKATRLGASPRWLAPTMITLMIIGLLWIVTYYLTETRYPIPGLDIWNLIIGFGITLVGFMMTTRWR